MSKRLDEQLSDRIRQTAVQGFGLPARNAGFTFLSIPVREVMAKGGEEARGRQSVFCSALKARKFLGPNGLQLEKLEGPPKGRGTSVIYHYRFTDDAPSPEQNGATSMTVEEAQKLAEKYLAPFRGALTREIRDFGGSEALIRWRRFEETTA